MTSAKSDCGLSGKVTAGVSSMDLYICGGNPDAQSVLAARLLALLPEDYSILVIQGRPLGRALESGETPGSLSRLEWREDEVLLQQRGVHHFRQEEDFSRSADVIIRLGQDPSPDKAWIKAGNLATESDNTPLATADQNEQDLQQALQQWLNGLSHRAPLYGLVLAGGRSKRMGKDKTLLKYHGKAQREVACELLAPHCEQVFLSQRADQNTSEHWPAILDRFADFGPMGGILSAMHTHPNAAWLVLASDLPFLNEQTLKQLLTLRAPAKGATAFRSSHDDLPEPLCAIWEPGMIHTLHTFMAARNYCPRKVLIKSGVRLLDLPDDGALKNVNHPEEFEAAKKQLAKGSS